MKIISVLLVFLAMSGLSTAQTVNDKDIENFCKGFVKTVNKHDMKASLGYFDTNYRIEQHDKFLEGNTKQFVEEFLSGYSDEIQSIGVLYVPDFYEIKKIKLSGIDFVDDNICYVVFEIRMNSGNSYVMAAHILFQSKSNMGFVGAMG